MLRPLRGTLSPLGRALGGASSWWLSGGISAANCIAAYASKGAASLAASKSNLASPGSYELQDGTAFPTWNAATGWTFGSGSAKYLSASIAWAGSYSLIVRLSGGSTVPDGSTLLATDGAASLGMSSRYFGLHAYQNGTRARFTGSPVSSGVMAVAGTIAYLDGTQDLTTLDGNGTGNTLYLGCASPGSAHWFGGSILALSIYNTTLTAAQVAAVTTAMQQL